MKTEILTAKRWKNEKETVKKIEKAKTL